MSTIKAVLEEEFGRLKKLKARYNREIAALPAGSLSLKTRKGKEYAYRSYREKNKVKTDYIGPADSEAAEKVKEGIKKRKKFEVLQKKTNQQITQVERSLHGKKI